MEVITKELGGNYRTEMYINRNSKKKKKSKKPHWIDSLADGDARTKSVNLGHSKKCTRSEQKFDKTSGTCGAMTKDPKFMSSGSQKERRKDGVGFPKK